MADDSLSGSSPTATLDSKSASCSESALACAVQRCEAHWTDRWTDEELGQLGMSSMLQRRRHIRKQLSTLAYKYREAQLQAECAAAATHFAETVGQMELNLLSIGDCHGGRTTQWLSRDVESHFFTGSIFSWISGKRSLPSLRSLLRNRSTGPRLTVTIFSYGEVDCRCHSTKWQSDDDDALATPYVSRIREYVAECCRGGCHTMLPIVLAVPPATGKGDVSLASRVAATEKLNAALERACWQQAVYFTGIDTWQFAQAEDGVLRSSLCANGHVSIKAHHCSPVHERLRAAICKHAHRGGAFVHPRELEARQQCEAKVEAEAEMAAARRREEELAAVAATKAREEKAKAKAEAEMAAARRREEELAMMAIANAKEAKKKAAAKAAMQMAAARNREEELVATVAAKAAAVAKAKMEMTAAKKEEELATVMNDSTLNLAEPASSPGTSRRACPGQYRVPPMTPHTRTAPVLRPATANAMTRHPFIPPRGCPAAKRQRALMSAERLAGQSEDEEAVDVPHSLTSAPHTHRTPQPPTPRPYAPRPPSPRRVAASRPELPPRPAVWGMPETHDAVPRTPRARPPTAGHVTVPRPALPRRRMARGARPAVPGPVPAMPRMPDGDAATAMMAAFAPVRSWPPTWPTFTSS